MGANLCCWLTGLFFTVVSQTNSCTSPQILSSNEQQVLVFIARYEHVVLWNYIHLWTAFSQPLSCENAVNLLQVLLLYCSILILTEIKMNLQKSCPFSICKISCQRASRKVYYLLFVGITSEAKLHKIYTSFHLMEVLEQSEKLFWV